MGERVPSPIPSPPPPPRRSLSSSPISLAQSCSSHLSNFEYEVLFHDAESLPTERLPSVEDIETSPHRSVLMDVRSRTTIRLDSDEAVVIKYGSDVNPSEAENLRFVRQQGLPGLIVPRVYAVYQHRSTDGEAVRTYILMEYVPGQNLQDLWDTFEPQRKGHHAQQLRSVFEELRSLPSPDYYGSLDRGKSLDNIFWTKDDIPSMNGPFSTMDELIEGMIARYEHDVGPPCKHKANYYRRVLPQVLGTNCKPVFTHNDLQRKNIIITPDCEIALIDWAASGWFPEFWEYAMAVYACGNWKDDWHEYVAEILDEYANEFAWMSLLRVEMWG